MHHRERSRHLVDLAFRWCPEASLEDRLEAARRLAWETAHARGLAREWDLDAPERPLPTQGERDLLDAAEHLLAGQDWAWPQDSTWTHPSGRGRGGFGTCMDCAWWNSGECSQAHPAAGAWPATTESCARFESLVLAESCLSCGACCRQGYTLAPVESDEALLKRHPRLVVSLPDGSCHIPRPGGVCLAIDPSPAAAGTFPCLVYPDRPRACSDLRPGSTACLEARRRTGLSR